MQNLMIIDDNILNVQKITNSISSLIDNLKLSNLSISLEESFHIIDKKEIDIILINVDIFGMDLLNYIYQKQYDYYRKSIILIYKNYNSLKNKSLHLYDKYIYKCIKINQESSNLLLELTSLVSFKEHHTSENLLKLKIKKELSKINYNLESIGSKHIIEGIILIKKSKKYKINLTQDIYVPLAQKYHTTINTIKGSITQATINMYYDCDENILKNYFGYLDDISKPTIKEIITTILDKI